MVLCALAVLVTLVSALPRASDCELERISKHREVFGRHHLGL